MCRAADFAGGQVSVTSKGGSNRVSGSLSSRYQDQNLSWGGNTSNVVRQSGNTNELLGGGFGGPIKRNKTFLFGSLQVNRRLAPLASLNLADHATLLRLGASPDSVTKFINQVGALGLTGVAGNIDPESQQRSGPEPRPVRLEHGPVAHRDDQQPVSASTPRTRRASARPSCSRSAAIPIRTTARISLQVASRMGRWVNQFRGGGSINDSHSDPFLFVPVGRVTNESTLDSGQIADTTFGFGGNAGLPQHNNTKNLEVTNELSVLPGNATHRFALGLYAFGSHFNQDVTNNRYGTYTYNSLADFQDNIPSQFTRTLQPTIRDGGAWNEAVYLSDAWRPRTARRAAPG